MQFRLPGQQLFVMRKKEIFNSIFQKKGKLSLPILFDFITFVKKQNNGNLKNLAPAWVLTFAFKPFSIIELSGSLHGDLV